MSTKLKETATRAKPQLIAPPNGLIFGRSLNVGGFYHDLLQGLKSDPSKVITINADDNSAYTQIKTRAKKAGMELLIAKDSSKVYFKLFVIPETWKLILDTLNKGSMGIDVLRGYKFECALESTLQDLARLGYIKLSPQSKWFLLEKGKEELLKKDL